MSSRLPKRPCRQCGTYEAAPGRVFCTGCLMEFVNSPANLRRAFPEGPPAPTATGAQPQ